MPIKPGKDHPMYGRKNPNAGRPKTLRARFREIFDAKLNELDEAEGVSQFEILMVKMIEQAKQGDNICLRMLMDRALPIADYKMLELEREVEHLRELLEEIKRPRIA